MAQKKSQTQQQVSIFNNSIAQARHFEFDKPDCKIENPGQRMMYIPKDTVAAYMKQVSSDL